MLRNTLYYNLKPFIPRPLRTAVRRQLAQRLRKEVGDVWPIMPGSEVAPNGWPGWPGGSKFALVLTHDVEGKAGLEKCRSLMQLEMEMGFRSSFHFVPEGNYRVPSALRQELLQNGFEIGVHDLRHDGRLFRSAAEFRKNAVRINRYLEDWKAVGFRSGFMLHNLDWLHQLNIEYDMSTFDTDPFEPQPEGRHTIFPNWIPRFPMLPNSSNGAVELTSASRSNGSAKGYVELPYTLPQDSTLFVLLREPSIDLWIRKVDWIVRHNGMVLLDTHPDYMNFSGATARSDQYPVNRYVELLEYIRSRYAGQYWHALPREVAAHTSRTKQRDRADHREASPYLVDYRTISPFFPKSSPGSGRLSYRKGRLGGDRFHPSSWRQEDASPRQACGGPSLFLLPGRCTASSRRRSTGRGGCNRRPDLSAR